MIHSALTGKGGICPSSDKRNESRFYNDRIITFQHDVCDVTVPVEFQLAEAIHVVIPWIAGYNKFVEHTIAKNTSFKDYLNGVKRIIDTLNVPTFILSGKQIAKMLNPNRQHNVFMSEYGVQSVYSVWNYDGALPNSSYGLEDFVGENFNWVLDFSCGYGEIMEHCKKAILTDVNTGCISHIVNRYELQEVHKNDS